MTEAIVVQAEEPKNENPSAIAEGTPSASMKHILIIYDDKTGRIPDPLEQNLQLMYRYLGNQVRRHYYRYRTLTEPKPCAGDNQFLKEQYQKEKEEYEEEVKKYKNARASMRWFLQQDQLFLVLIVTNSVMEYLLEDMQQDPQLSSLLTHPNHRIVHVLVRPTAGVSHCEPLCAYEGTALEVACQHIATTIESIAREYFFGDLMLPRENPLTLLTSPTSIHVSVPDRTAQMLAGLLGPVQAMLEQTNARIVESQQLAIAERSQREITQASEADLRRQIEHMDERLKAVQKQQNTSLLTKLRRWFKVSSSN